MSLTDPVGVPPRVPGAVALAAGLLLAGLLGAGASRAEVVLEGLSRTTERAVRANLALASEACNITESRRRRQFRRADAQIRSALEVYGYYEPVIDKSLDEVEGCWRATFRIQRGPRVRLRTIDVASLGPGAQDPELSRLVARAPFEKGEGLNQRAYDTYKAEIASLARDRGYFDGRWAASRIDVYPVERAADITHRYETGARYRFGPVEFEQEVLEPGLVQGFVDFRPGEYYDGEAVNAFYTALLVSGFFQGVDVRTTPRPDSQDVLITVALTPSVRRNAKAGFGYGTDTGLKVNFGYLDRRRNDRGHQIELDSTLSQVVGEVTASYRTPLDKPKDEWRSFDAGYKYDNPEDSRSEQYRIGVKEIHRRGRHWRETRFIDLSFEDYQIGEDDDTSRLLVPGMSWSTQTELLPSRPRKAGRIGFQVSGTSTVLGSDTSFLQLESTGKIIRSLWWEGGRVLLRGEVGATLKDELEELPLSVRYFAGGDYSVRGYDYKSLGPTDESGEVIGGTHRLVGSVEVDQQFRTAWAVAAFVDIGNAFDTFSDMTLKTGVGAGIRWYSPLGPIRLDLAFPLDEDAPDSFRVHITLGPEL